MALGSNRASASRKTDLIIRIQLKMARGGMSKTEVIGATRGFRRKTVSELLEILTNMRRVEK